ncbi:MAG: prenyltransferase/squalene oxidase repeat-containing protein [bacterium]
MNIFTRLLGLATLTLLLASSSNAAPSVIQDVKYQRAFDEAVDKGLSFLAKSQTKDGAIGEKQSPAITSLAVMAFLARGHTPGLPPYGDVINHGIDFILTTPDTKGTMMGGQGQMYSHNIACLMLSEVSGMVDPERQARIDAILPRAIRIILDAQDVNKPESMAGGWRYQPTSTDSDISLAGWALAALRSTRNNGAPVPKEAIDKAVKFILRCRTQDNGFAYQPGGGANLARTGIGLLCLELSGRHREDVTLKAGQYIINQFKKDSPFSGDSGRYYALYYVANGMFQLGGPEWEAFAPILYDTILKTQSKDGSWPISGSHDKDITYCTSMAILSLSVSYRQLPIYQR